MPRDDTDRQALVSQQHQEKQNDLRACLRELFRSPSIASLQNEMFSAMCFKQ